MTSTPNLLQSTLQSHCGRPTVMINGRPIGLTAYSPCRRYFHQQVARFFPHQMDVYLISLSMAKGNDYFRSAFWEGDRIESAPILPEVLSLNEQGIAILAGDPNAMLMVRFGCHEPASWRKLHPDHRVVTEQGQALEVPSLASDAFWDAAARFSVAIITYCERQPWAHRIMGYANFGRMEGTHEPMLTHDLFDHSTVMTQAWRAYLREKYVTEGELQRAYGDSAMTFANAQVPKDPLQGSTEQAARYNYWQAASGNQPLRDYLLLVRKLYGEGFKKIAKAQADTLAELGRKRVLVYDAIKQVMLGWCNLGFFDPQVPWPLAYSELMAGSGHLGVSELLDAPGVDGLITPHDYQARGVGGVFEPEGIADSAVLRGKLMLCEMDTRTWKGTNPNFPAKNADEFAAITWRNIATALTRGFVPYYMDVYEDWFSDPAMHRIIARQMEVMQEALHWPHATVPGIAVILDDWCVLETNGDGHFLHEAVMQEWKHSLARCGVPFRTYLLEDLERDNFPDHRVFYFPNLFKIDSKRMELLARKVLRNGHVVVWGPGSGISDGHTVSPEHASRLTGFHFHDVPTRGMRRTLITNFDHPITHDLPSDTMLGGPLAYGPMLYPLDGTRLGAAWTKEGRDVSGLAVKEMPGWHSVFSSAVPLSASLWRGLARFAGAHVYCDDNEVMLANSSLVAIHALRNRPLIIRLPGEYRVHDVITGEYLGTRLTEIRCQDIAPYTKAYRLEPC